MSRCGNLRFSRLLALVAVLTVAAVGLTACGSGSSSDTSASTSGDAGAEATGDKVNLAFFGLAANNTYTQSMYEAAKEQASKMNGDVQFFDGKFDGAVQARQVQDAITSGRFEGFIIMPNDAPSIIPIVKQADQAGIKVAALEYPIGTDPASVEPQLQEVTTQVIEDVIVGAGTVADEVNRACEAYDDPCKVAMLWGARSLPTDAVKVPVFKKALDPGIKLVAETDANYLTADGQKATTDILQANPDVNVIVSVGDQMSIGAQQAIERAGKSLGNEPGSITVIGYGATDKGVKAIREGKWMSAYALVPIQMGKKVTEVLVDAIRGKEPTEEQRSIVQTEISPIGKLATKETLEDHPEFEGEYTG